MSKRARLVRWSRAVGGFSRFCRDLPGFARNSSVLIVSQHHAPTEWLKARVRLVSDRLAELPTYTAERASFKEIALDLPLHANAGDQAQVAEIFTEAMRGDPDEVESFRLCLSNWLVDKVVDGWPPLPEELNPPTEA